MNKSKTDNSNRHIKNIETTFFTAYGAFCSSKFMSFVLQFQRSFASSNTLRYEENNLQFLQMILLLAKTDFSVGLLATKP